MSQDPISQAPISQAYVIEVRSQAAGIVVRNGRGYRFFAATHDFNSLDGQAFGSPRDAEKAALRHIAARDVKTGQRPPTITYGARHS